MFPSQQGSNFHVFLLNIRAPAPSTVKISADLASLPEIGERVLVALKSNEGDSFEEAQVGKLVQILGQYASFGRNVAVSAERPPSYAGRILEHRQITDDFFFGYSGSPVNAPREFIIEAMMGVGDIGSNVGVQWFKQILLSHDNYYL